MVGVGRSQAEEEEEQMMKQAIAQSLREQTQPAPPSIIIPSGSGIGGGVSKEDEEMARAIEQSLIGPSELPPSSNPHNRVKEPGGFTGLKNIGNTCYFNSLLQTYYSIPAFRGAVMSCPSKPPSKGPEAGAAGGVQEQTTGGGVIAQGYPVSDAVMVDATSAGGGGSAGTGGGGGTEEGAKEKEKRRADEIEATTVQFVLELQRLFASMALSERKCVDPSQVMHKLLDANGHPVHIGNQQDVNEFNHIFLQRVGEGLDTLHGHKRTKPGEAEGGEGEGDGNQPKKGIVQELFEGRMLQELIASETGGGKVVLSTSKADFMELILNIESGDVHAAMEGFVVDKVEDYVGSNSKQREDGGHVEKSLWFEEFPPILTFHLQRVNYDKMIQVTLCTCTRAHAREESINESSTNRFMRLCTRARASERASVYSQPFFLSG